MAFIGLRSGTRVLLEGATAYLARDGRLFRMQTSEFRRSLTTQWDDDGLGRANLSEFLFAPFPDRAAALGSVERGAIDPIGEPLMSDEAR